MKKNTNLIDETDPKDRPIEAVAQLRDIAEWLRRDGHLDLAANLYDEADRIVRRYGV